MWFQNRRSKERRMKQSRVCFRPSRRNRGNILRNDEINGVFCDILGKLFFNAQIFNLNKVN